MIVTCESCQSKYKLDDSKITGRGAKITCPKCRHVFVVYTQQAAAARAPAAPAPASGGADDPYDDSWDDSPTRIGGAKPPPSRPGGAPPSADLSNGVGAIANPRRSNPGLISPPSPEPDNSVVYLPPPPGGAPSDAAARASALDFRKVGVSTWKVKIKLGLVYDFSDIKTLRKYIQDGRVTAADVISYDGKTWKPIGEIPDLDVFFLETWDRLNRARQDSPSVDVPPPNPTIAVQMAGPDVHAPDPRTPSEPNTFRDPFDELKSRQRERVAARRATAPVAPTPSGNVGGYLKYVAALVLLLAAGGGAAWWWSAEHPVTTVSPNAGKVPNAPTAQQIRDKINQDITDKLRPVDPPPADPSGTTPPVVGADGLPPLPVPEGVTNRPGIPDGAVPVVPKNIPTNGGTSTMGKTGQVKIDTIRSTDYIQIGDASARTGDWSGAAQAYQKAVDMEPSSASLLYKLGDAQKRSGQVDAAYDTLRKAAAAGARDAYKLLGDIARERGDVADASAQYNEYLKGNPRDAAQIEAVLKGLGAG